MTPDHATASDVEGVRGSARDGGGDASEDSRAMRAEIESTRVRMSQTLDAIGERLNPQTIKENVKDSIREATIGRVTHMARHAADSVDRGASGITNVVRENPVPAAMIAIGLGWMLFNGRSERGEPQLVSRVKGKTSDLADSVKEHAHSIAETVSQTGRRGQGRVEEAFRANPLALGAVAIAAGLAVGFSAPVTDREARLMA